MDEAVASGRCRTLLVCGATGQTGRPFVDLALEAGHHVRALVRDPAKLHVRHPELEVRQGSITDPPDLRALLRGVDAVVMMVGDRQAQQLENVNSVFVRLLVPAMRQRGVQRLLYQAGGFSAPPSRQLPTALRLLRSTIARSYLGQHRDNEAVMRYLADEALHIRWVVHRAGLRPGKGSRGILRRSDRRPSIATFSDCAAYNLRLLTDDSAVHTCSGSRYVTKTAKAR